MRTSTTICLISLLAAGCSVDIPEGVFKCKDDSECPEDQTCALNGFCKSSGGSSGSSGTGGSGEPCVPNETEPCDCPEGDQGVRTCTEDGKWGECEPCEGGEAGGGGGGTGGGPDEPTRVECMRHVPNSVDLVCKGCICDACPSEAMACESDCWVLIGCLLTECPEFDQDCLFENCGDKIVGSAEPALSLMTCSAVDCGIICQ
jgi:hypothetical protein